MSAKHISWIMEFATAIVIGVVLVLIASGCTNERQWRQVASTARLEYGETRGGMDPHVGNKDYDSDSYYIGVSISPLAFLEPPREVVVVQQPCGAH